MSSYGTVSVTNTTHTSGIMLFPASNKAGLLVNMAIDWNMEHKWLDAALPHRVFLGHHLIPCSQSFLPNLALLLFQRKVKTDLESSVTADQSAKAAIIDTAPLFFQLLQVSGSPTKTKLLGFLRFSYFSWPIWETTDSRLNCRPTDGSAALKQLVIKIRLN